MSQFHRKVIMSSNECLLHEKQSHACIGLWVIDSSNTSVYLRKKGNCNFLELKFYMIDKRVNNENKHHELICDWAIAISASHIRVFCRWPNLKPFDTMHQKPKLIEIKAEILSGLVHLYLISDLLRPIHD